jgi:hypothetical protein
VNTRLAEENRLLCERLSVVLGLSGGSTEISQLQSALGDQVALVERRDPVGELVGFLEVLGSGEDQRRQDVHRRRLARTVGAEHRKNRSRGNIEVAAVEHDFVAICLAQP